MRRPPPDKLAHGRLDSRQPVGIDAAPRRVADDRRATGKLALIVEDARQLRADAFGQALVIVIEKGN